MGHDRKDWGRLYGGGQAGVSMEGGRWAGGTAEQSRELSKAQDGRNKLSVLLAVNRGDGCRELSAGTGGGSIRMC